MGIGYARAARGGPSCFVARLVAIAACVLCLVLPAVASASPAAFTYPTDGAMGVDPSVPFAWTTSTDGQGYYLTIGTTVGGRDVLDTGEIQSTSWVALPLPASTQLYARIYTLIAGVWEWSDAAFTATVPPHASFVYPTDGETGVTLAQPFSWTAVANAVGYYLTIGTTSGGRDLLDSGGPLPSTTYDVEFLPTGQKLYATVYALVGTAWVPNQITFTVASIGAHFTSPSAGATNIYSVRPFAWSTVHGSQGYYLTIGSTPGARDVLDTGEISTTSYTVPSLPPSTTLYATMYTLLCGNWYPSTISFTTGPPLTSSSYAPQLTYPTNGATGVDVSQPFAWTDVPVADLYYLTVGSTPGARDVINTGGLSDSLTTYFGGALPQKLLYATIYSRVFGGWYASSISFTPGPPPTIATFVNPTSGATGVDLYQGFDWTDVSGAQNYYLVVGTHPGGRDVYDSAEIRLGGGTHRFVPMLQPSTTYYASIYTQVNGNWFPSSVSFTTGADTGIDFSANQASIIPLVDTVRSMADTNGNPTAGTTLYNVVTQAGRTIATCQDYALALLQEMSAVKVQNAVNITIAFVTGSGDTHDVVQVYSSAQGEWVLLDPTFDLVPYRASDGMQATASDINQATLAMSWSSITYSFMSAKNGDKYAKSYYLDYPLLYLNVPGSTSQPEITPYIVSVGTSTDTFGPYLVSAPGTGAIVDIDGTFVGLAPTPAGPFSGFVMGKDLNVLCPSNTLYTGQRFVF